MATRERLSDEAVTAFLDAHPGWALAGGAFERVFNFSEYSAGVAFAVRVAMAAERRDHHPDILISWGKVRIAWSTHDVGGLTALDAEMAGMTDRLYGG